MSRLLRPDPIVQQNILAAIRAGGFVHIAAAAFGVFGETLKRWLRLGASGKDPSLAAFARGVKEAQATARLAAEMQVHQKDPKLWLRAGPGRETAVSRGWTTFVKPHKRVERKQNFFAAPDFMQWVATLQKLMAPYPEVVEAFTDLTRCAEGHDR